MKRLKQIRFSWFEPIRLMVNEIRCDIDIETKLTYMVPIFHYFSSYRAKPIEEQSPFLVRWSKIF